MWEVSDTLTLKRSFNIAVPGVFGLGVSPNSLLLISFER